MCGIAGYLSLGESSPQEKIIKEMCDSIYHRGPDDEGFFVNGKIALGMRRLSIIDLKGGHQPIHNEDKTVWIVFNGEIYNFGELKKDLVKKGHKFYTHTDTEVIVHLYEDLGERCLDKLNGMFGLAIWDQRKEKLFLARDRLGKKPLYYSEQNGNFVFGSELKCLLKHPKINKELDFNSLSRYLVYEYVPCPYSIFKNIYKLEAGSYLTHQRGQTKIEPYWDASFETADKSGENFLEELDKKIEASVNKRLISDVPLGVFLSGGLDSSTIAYYMSKNSSKVESYSIGFSDPSFDESGYARQVAKFLGTNHHEQILEAKDMYELFPKVADVLDEPLADASIIPTYLLSKFTRTGVKVALGGDGGDELFMGYPTFQAHRLAQFYQTIPKPLRKKLIEPGIQRLPTSYNNISFDFKLKKFVDAFNYHKDLRHQLWLGTFSEDAQRELLAPRITEQLNDNLLLADLALYPKLNELSYWNRIIYLYLKQYLLDDILVKVDRASMFTSLEVRAPFLDYQLVEFINSMPHKLKLKRFKTKYLLKKLMSNRLPKNIVNRSKKGFGIPVGKWIKGELKDFTMEILSKERIEKQNIFNYKVVKNLLDEHLTGKKDNRKFLWTLMVFQMWQERWG